MKKTGAARPIPSTWGRVTWTGNAHKGSAFQPGLAYDAGLFEYAAFTCGANLGVFTGGSCDFLESIGVPTNPQPEPALDRYRRPGRQPDRDATVTSVAQDNGWRTYTVSVERPGIRGDGHPRRHSA